MQQSHRGCTTKSWHRQEGEKKVKEEEREPEEEADGSEEGT